MTPDGTPENPREREDDGSSGERAEVVKRPYVTPRLRRLGSVRELTLGGTMGITDGAGGRQTM